MQPSCSGAGVPARCICSAPGAILFNGIHVVRGMVVPSPTFTIMPRRYPSLHRTAQAWFCPLSFDVHTAKHRRVRAMLGGNLQKCQYRNGGVAQQGHTDGDAHEKAPDPGGNQGLQLRVDQSSDAEADSTSAAGHMWSIMTWPNPEQLTCMAPSIKRAKS